MRFRFTLLLSAALLAACSGPPPARQASAPTPPQPPQPAKPAPVQALQPPDPVTTRVTQIDSAAFNGAAAPTPAPTAGAKAQPDDLLIRIQTMLDRARFSPGVIDGLDGTNFHHALAAYQGFKGLPTSGHLDDATWKALMAEPTSTKPEAQVYVLSPEDEAGPFAPDVGEDFVKLAALPGGPQFSTPQEMLAARFHMSRELLASLNPGVDFSKPGARLIVADPGSVPLMKGQVASITVSKDHAQVEAFDASGALLASYPATVGSTERPSPSGIHKINGVAWHTDYVYDPKKLHWGPRSHGKLVIKAGPKGPVGTTWIDLNAPDYGIHGSPDPEKIGKTASHGCVRLTNWDAEALAGGVKPGVKVSFEGNRKKA